MKDYLKVAVTGDVDSGKSTLIGRLLYELDSLSSGAMNEIYGICKRLGRDFEFAYLLDSLEEERQDQLTIDTTQVFCKTEKGKGFFFIDVPGHQELMKKMLSGSSYADMAVLVVDMQKPIEAQTKRHAFILKFLGINQIIVTLNKMDEVAFAEDKFEQVKKDTAGFLKKIELQPKHFVPVSAKQGENLIIKSPKMHWYKGLPLFETLDVPLKKINNQNFVFLVQDIYKIDKEMFAVGEIISGEIKVGERVKILPLNRESSVKTIRDFNKNKKYTKAPESIGMILEDMKDVRRGEVICRHGLLELKTEILAKLYCVRQIEINKTLRFRCATQDTLAEFKEIKGIWDTATLEVKSEGNILQQNDLVEAVIVTREPMVVTKFGYLNSLGRFVLQNDEREIYAVGIID
jgi:small GTP-binding protein